MDEEWSLEEIEAIAAQSGAVLALRMVPSPDGPDAEPEMEPHMLRLFSSPGATGLPWVYMELGDEKFIIRLEDFERITARPLPRLFEAGPE